MKLGCHNCLKNKENMKQIAGILFTITIVVFLISVMPLHAQQLDVDGSAKIGVMPPANTADSLAVWTADGTLARRDVSSLPFSELQILTISNDTIFLSNGGFVKLPEASDADPTNEIQELSVSEFGDTMYIQNGNYLIIPGVSAANGPVDGDGYIYKTVEINGQLWFAENLRTTTYNDGTPLPHVLDGSIWTSFNQPAYCYFDNDSIINRQTYGALYNSFAIRTINPKNVCPVNWHVATAENWDSLIVHLGGTGVAGGKLKEVGFVHWDSPNTGATDQVNFSARGGGRRLALGNFFSLRRNADFWGIRRPTDSSERTFGLSFFNDNVTDQPTLGSENFGYSVRCVRD